ncbi:hypothetical protein PASE110613_07520 [Paenibacillus sediminis]|uniref:Uncharacterized protein n=1 Tax=Paenibacillus sediminis TaxID=664909 RepID=A0ABS4H2P6_9BACL|nr:hypothetical protein [Paenibacillus sediminis]
MITIPDVLIITVRLILSLLNSNAAIPTMAVISAMRKQRGMSLLLGQEMSGTPKLSYADSAALR